MADLLAIAHGNEIDWQHAAPLLRGAKKGQMPFIYFVGEENAGAVKIGQAAHPIKRLRELQTGNPRRLRIERLVWGDRTVEQLIHGYLREFMIDGKRQATTYKPTFAKDTEWFRSDAHELILAAADEICSEQRARLDREAGGITAQATQEGAAAALERLGYTLHKEDEVRLLGQHGGYVTVGLGTQGAG